MLIDEIKQSVRKKLDKRREEERIKKGFDKIAFFDDFLEIELNKKTGDKNGIVQKI